MSGRCGWCCCHTQYIIWDPAENQKEKKAIGDKVLNGAYGMCGNLCVTGELQVSQQAKAMTIQIHVGEVKKNDALAREAAGTLF